MAKPVVEGPTCRPFSHVSFQGVCLAEMALKEGAEAGYSECEDILLVKSLRVKRQVFVVLLCFISSSTSSSRAAAGALAGAVAAAAVVAAAASAVSHTVQ